MLLGVSSVELGHWTASYQRQRRACSYRNTGISSSSCTGLDFWCPWGNWQKLNVVTIQASVTWSCSEGQLGQEAWPSEAPSPQQVCAHLREKWEQPLSFMFSSPWSKITRKWTCKTAFSSKPLSLRASVWSSPSRDFHAGMSHSWPPPWAPLAKHLSGVRFPFQQLTQMSCRNEGSSTSVPFF